MVMAGRCVNNSAYRFISVYHSHISFFYQQGAWGVMKMVCNHYLIVRATVFPPLAKAFVASSLNGFPHFCAGCWHLWILLCVSSCPAALTTTCVESMRTTEATKFAPLCYNKRNSSFVGVGFQMMIVWLVILPKTVIAFSILQRWWATRVSLAWKRQHRNWRFVQKPALICNLHGKNRGQ